MKTLLTIVLAVSALAAFSQENQTFDIMTFTPPSGWKKEISDFSVSYVIAGANGAWCRVTFHKSVLSSGNPALDFGHEWQDLVDNGYPGARVPQAPVSFTENGWLSTYGGSSARWRDEKVQVILTTVTGYGIKLSTLISMNGKEFMNQAYRFVESIRLKKPGDAEAKH